MIPINLSVSGFLSYREPVELSFSDFDLACISGANGSGKSALLDAITWALFGQARRRDDELINSRAKGAQVTLDFEYEDNVFRVQRSKMRGKSTTLEFFVQNDKGEWRTLSERTLRETEVRIEQTLRMDYETFINASFFLQGKADLFAQQRPGDRKRILSNILGLEVWEIYRERTAERRKKREIELAGLDSRLAEIESELQQENERRERLKTLQEDLGILVELRKAKERSLESMRQLAASMEEQNRLVQLLGDQLKAVIQRRDQMRESLQVRKEDSESCKQKIEQAAEIEAAYQNWQKLRTDLEDWEVIASNFREYESQRSAPLILIETERSRLEQENSTLQEQHTQFSILKEQIPDLESQLKAANEAVLETTRKVEERSSLEEELGTLQEKHAQATAENQHLKDEMTELKNRIDQLNNTSGVECPLCGQPLNQEERENLIKKLEKEGTELGDQYRHNQELFRKGEERREEIKSALAMLQTLDVQLRQEQRKADQVEDRLMLTGKTIEEWQSSGAIRFSEVSKSLKESNYALDARSELAKIDAALKEIGYDSAAHDAIRQAEQEIRSSEVELRELENARSALEPLEREIKDLEKRLESDESEVISLEKSLQSADKKYQEDSANLPDISQFEEGLFDLQEKENQHRVQVGGAIQAVEVLKTLQSRQQELKEQRQEHTHKIAQLKTLERSFGKDGVPALLIEQALPEIEFQANEILNRLTSSGMSIRFETQQLYKDKKRKDKRETLDIMISDAAGARDYAMFSGGEAFRVNFAIRLALSRVLAQRAGARLQTLVIDEGFGSQDAEGRQRIIEAINIIRPDFAKVLIITHLDEMKDAFTTRIEVNKTPQGSQLKVVE
ncbi:MAG: SMC family ATPase [Anaerolineaceae bacterium]|nr:SMC family ATPase [Anaerolineaceae bacterium]